MMEAADNPNINEALIQLKRESDERAMQVAQSAATNIQKVYKRALEKD